MSSTGTGSTGGSTGGADAGAPDAGADAGSDAGLDAGGLLELPPSSVPAVVPPAGPTVYVDAVNGSPSGDGSEAAPFDTIQAGLAAVAGDGGTVLIKAGRYQGPLAVSGVARPVLLQAAPGEEPVLSCSQPVTGWLPYSGAIYQATPPVPVAQVFYGDDFLQRARYPATGFLTIGADAPPRPDGGYNTVLPLQPADATFLAGQDLSHTVVTVRDIDYWFNSAVVQGVDAGGAALVLANPPPANLAAECYPNCSFTYPPMNGWGYYLENALWMMSQPGSWVYDPDANTLYAWLPGGADPNTVSVEAASSADCLVVSGSPNLQVQGLTIANSGGSGVVVGSPGTRWNRVKITRARRQGLSLGQAPFVFDESWISDTGSDAIAGYPGATAPLPSELVIESSHFTDIGLKLGPRFVGGTIRLHATNLAPRVRNNQLLRQAYVGISPPQNALIEGNTVEDFCLYADDCGGIYISGYDTPQTVRGNIVRRATSNLEGKGRGPYPVAGIYLDDFSEGMTVEDNVVGDTDIGMMLHNGFDNAVHDNQVFRFSRFGLYAQEDQTRKRYNWSTYQFEAVLDSNGQPQPALGNNLFERNAWADDLGAPLIKHATNQGSTLARLQAAYAGSQNSYWNLYSPVVVDSSAGRFAFEDLVSQGLDSAPARATATFLSVWATTGVVANAFTASPANLGSFPSYTSSGTVTKTVVSCPSPSGSGGCLEFVPSSSAPTSLLQTPAFPITDQQFYRCRLQMMSATSASPWLQVYPRRNGPTYEVVDALGSALRFKPAAGAWTEYDFYFQANESIGNARLDIEVPQGSDVILGDARVDEVSVQPDPPENHLQGLVDVDYLAPETFACALAGAPCGGWTDLSGASVSFPVDVPARGAQLLWHP